MPPPSPPPSCNALIFSPPDLSLSSPISSPISPASHLFPDLLPYLTSVSSLPRSPLPLSHKRSDAQQMPPPSPCNGYPGRRFQVKRIESLTEVELEALLEQVEEEKRRLESSEQVN